MCSSAHLGSILPSKTFRSLTQQLQYFMFPETYGRTLEELAFLFEDHARADEATTHVQKQMEWSERRWSRIEERMSWEMDVLIPTVAQSGRREETRNDSILHSQDVIRRHDMMR
jgi:hypothetical protein